MKDFSFPEVKDLAINLTLMTPPHALMVVFEAIN